MVLYLDSRLFRVYEMVSCREELDMEEDSQPETSINKPEKFKPINWVKWSKEFGNYIDQCKTACKAGVSIPCIIKNNAKRSNTASM